MVLKKFFYVLFYRTRKFFDCKRGHINRNVQGSRFGLKSSKRELPLRDESDARTHRTPNSEGLREAALGAKVMRNAGSISRKLSEVRTRPRVTLQRLAEELSARG